MNMKLTIEIDQAVLDVYNEMEGDLYSEEMKAGFAFKLMKFEFEKKIVAAVMESYENKNSVLKGFNEGDKHYFPPASI